MLSDSLENQFQDLKKIEIGFLPSSSLTNLGLLSKSGEREKKMRQKITAYLFALIFVLFVGGCGTTNIIIQSPTPEQSYRLSNPNYGLELACWGSYNKKLGQESYYKDAIPVSFSSKQEPKILDYETCSDVTLEVLIRNKNRSHFVLKKIVTIKMDGRKKPWVRESIIYSGNEFFLPWQLKGPKITNATITITAVILDRAVEPFLSDKELTGESSGQKPQILIKTPSISYRFHKSPTRE